MEVSIGRRFLGGLLVATGILIAGLSGLCTLVVGGITIFSSGRLDDILGSLTLVLTFGGPPILVGVGLIVLGRRLGWPRTQKINPDAF